MLKLFAAMTLAVAAFTVPVAAAPTSVPAKIETGEKTATLVRHFRGGHHHRFHRGVFIGVPVYTYGSAYGSCRWLRHRAEVTGSSYWWRRYHRCRHGW
jgi:hypothetical protein